MKKKIIAVFSAVLILGLLMFTAVSAAGKAELSGGNVNGYAGAMVDFPLILNAGENVAAIDITVDYDSSSLSYISDISGEFENCLIQAHSAEAGTVKAAMINADGVTGEKVLMKLRFEVLHDATGSLNIRIAVTGAVNANQKAVSVSVKDGKINIAGRVGVNSTVVDNNNEVIGSIDDEGNMTDKSGNPLGTVANDDTKSAAESSYAAEQSAIKSAVDATSGTEVASAADSSTAGSGFKFESWMLYVLIGILFVAAVVICVISVVKGKKQKEQKEKDDYKNVYDDSSDR